MSISALTRGRDDERNQAHRPRGHCIGHDGFPFCETPGFHFDAGQAIDLILPDSVAAEAQSTRHTFSIVSAPFEDRIAVATRMRDSLFKRALKGLSIGSRP